MQRLSCFVLVLLICCGPAAAEVDLASLEGKRIWLKPARAMYLRVDFYPRPKPNVVPFHVRTKAQFSVDRVTRIWVRIVFTSSEVDHEGYAYVLTGIFRRGLYTASSDNADEYNRASFFTEDPDLIKARLDAAAVPAAISAQESNPAARYFKHTKKICCVIPEKGAVPPKRATD
jgi:hypothetical protein